jgi:bifunctional enzyme CysN/CysC
MNAQSPAPVQGAIPVHNANSRIFPIVIVGHVDHGKSTLIGRLMYDTGSIDPTKVAELESAAIKRGRPVEWSFLLDALELERDQGITLDTTRIWFATNKRPYVIIDAPGHHELIRNMLTGAASAEAAILVIDASQGMGEQTRRHANLLSLLGMAQVLVAINKIDLIDHDEIRFQALADDIRAYLQKLNLSPQAIVPVSARSGDNIASASAATPWYRGPTLLAALDQFSPTARLPDAPLRLPIQDIWFRDDQRILVGRIDAGSLSVGDELVFAPSGSKAKVTELLAWGPGTKPTTAQAGESIALTLDTPVLLERGTVAHRLDQPPQTGHRMDLRLIWLDREPLQLAERLSLRIGTQDIEVHVDAIHDIIDLDTLGPKAARSVPANAIARVSLTARKSMVADAISPLSATGRAVLARRHRVVAGAWVSKLSDELQDNLTPIESHVTSALRHSINGHGGGVLWMTGYSGSGKSTLAVALEAALATRGWRAFVLDGDNLRKGLNGDLDFSAAARAENMRRAAEVAKLMAQAGLITIVSLISPYENERRRVREIVGPGFHEIHVATDLETCIARDPKGLYARAKQGLVRDFTGIDSPYEVPTSPDFVVNPGKQSQSDCLGALMAYTLEHFDLDAGRLAKENFADGI